MFEIIFSILLISQVSSENSAEINTKLTSDEQSNYNESSLQNATVSTDKSEPITYSTEPSAQSQHIPKTIEPDKNDSIMKKTKGDDEFRPSPEVKEVTYERNMFPVKPAYPEAKYSSSSRDDQFGRKPDVPWERPNEQPWTSPANFKFPQNNVHTSKDRPYQFVGGNGRTYHGFSGKNDLETSLHKPQISLGSKIPVSSSGSGSGIGGSWDITASLYPDSKYSPKKPNYGYDYGGYVDKPSTGIEHHGGYDYPLKKYENPWKKIIKIIAAFIPIGLLISALTPTIITVSPMNSTMMRSRHDDTQTATIKKLISSLGYFDQLNDKDCENRILCELLLSASTSQNAEQHIENLLSNFSDREKYTTERVVELKMIFEAVKRHQCESIICKGIKGST